MNKFTKIFVAIGAVFLLIGLLLVGGCVSANNYAVTQEQNIIAQDEQSQNVLGQLAPKIKEALGVTKLQTNALREVVSGANETRYGKSGSQATIQWIQEQNPTLDQSNYGKIIEMIEGARNDFSLAQEKKIDMVRSYRTNLNIFPGSLFYRSLGYPTEDFFKKYGEIVISNHAADAFRTHRDDGLDLINPN